MSYSHLYLLLSIFCILTHPLDPEIMAPKRIDSDPFLLPGRSSTMMLGEESAPATYWKQCGDAALSHSARPSTRRHDGRALGCNWRADSAHGSDDYYGND